MFYWTRISGGNDDDYVMIRKEFQYKSNVFHLFCSPFIFSLAKEYKAM